MVMILNVRWWWDWAFRPLSRRVTAAPRGYSGPRGADPGSSSQVRRRGRSPPAQSGRAQNR